MGLNIVSWTANVETNMRAISNDEYARFQRPENKWWDTAATRLTVATTKQILTWFVNSAQLYPQGQGGNFSYADPLQLTTDFTPATSGAAVKVRRQEIEDIDGNGVLSGAALAPLTAWARDMGAQFGYWPQLQIAALIKAATGTTLGTAYDGLAYFHTAHFNNGKDSSDGTYANLLSGGTYAPATGVSDDVRLAALAKVYLAMAIVKNATGTQVRMLRPSAILCGPSLYPTMARLLDSKFIAANASVAGAGGSSDFSGFLTRLGYGRVMLAPELVESEWDTNYIVLADRGGEADLGAFVYVDREPYSIRYYTGRGGGTGVDAILDSADVLEWHASGRNTAGFGHPFLAFKAAA